MNCLYKGKFDPAPKRTRNNQGKAQSHILKTRVASALF